MFKFELHALVVLVTSAQMVMEDLQDEADEAAAPAKQDEGDELAGLAKVRMGIIEEGEVIGRAQYVNADPSYFVRYKAGDGCQKENWFTEDALTTRTEIEAVFKAGDGSSAAAAAGGADFGAEQESDRTAPAPEGS